MPARPVLVDDLPAPLAPLFLLVGDEELLVERAISAVGAAARRDDPATVRTERAGTDLDAATLHELLGPSLFGDARLVIVTGAQDISSATLAVLAPYLQAPGEGTVIVLAHAGGAKGKAVLEAARTAKAVEVGCAKLTRAEDRVDFVRAEVRRSGGRIDPEAAGALVEAIGTDLRELAAVASQLVSDGTGTVTAAAVRAYRTGRADVKGFDVADQVMAGNATGALETLRYALDVGVAHVLIADALADAVSTLAKVAGAGRGEKYALASRLGIAPFKVGKAQGQMRSWSEPAVRRALVLVASLNADVKGAAADGGYALERAVRQLVALRGRR
ncbi:MAG: DNA polymerase III subunit delta [Jatrophihabitans sp.]|nr:MAG: DNA polymerase III subunit delta [Jatrophihabitans sp.]